MISYSICLSLTYFASIMPSKVYPRYCKWKNFIIFYGWVVFHCVCVYHIVFIYLSVGGSACHFICCSRVRCHQTQYCIFRTYVGKDFRPDNISFPTAVQPTSIAGKWHNHFRNFMYATCFTGKTIMITESYSSYVIMKELGCLPRCG